MHNNQQFFRHNIFVNMCEKVSVLHLDVSLFYNCWEKVPKLGEKVHRFVQYFFLFFNFLWPFSCDWRKTKQCNIFLKVFKSLWQTLNLLKIVKTIFLHIIVLQSWKNCHRMYTNLMVPGSENVTFKLSFWKCSKCGIWVVHNNFFFFSSFI